MKNAFFFLLIFLSSLNVSSQQENTDTVKTMDEVSVRAFEQNRSRQSAITSVSIITAADADRSAKTSLVSGFNTIAGVKMEERSPGSYRINIRGSSLRSPFGVRNVKVYWNDIPVTDPGGNTYFNQFALNSFSYLEIFKGPAGSLYGAGTGGLILMHNLSPWQPGISAEYLRGSYNLQNIFLSARYGKEENMNQVTFAHNSSDGYRVQSKMRRDQFSWTTKLKISEKQEFSASLLYTDLYYQTPGALTLAEFKNNPKAARPAAGALPSAAGAKAAIKQMNFLAGFNHDYKITPNFSNHSIFYGSFAGIKNPAIRNYEKRTEPNFGGRTIFKFDKKENGFNWQMVMGSEFQHGFFNTIVFRNLDGSPDTIQTDDDIVFTTGSVFIQSDMELAKHWFVNAGFSLNRSQVRFTRLNQLPVVTQKRTYRNEVAPRISVRKDVTDNFVLRATISRGYSPPTIAELLPSTGVISTNLEAEYGWNYELNTAINLLQKKFRVEATGFYFKLKDALVQRRDSSGADFFVNAGDVKQKGLELTADYTNEIKKGVIDYYIIKTAFTFNNFHYGSFIRGANENYSGKTVPSVPANTISVLLDLYLKNGLYTSVTYYAASKIYLNDANSALSDPYHLLGWRLGWKKTINKKIRISFYAGVDNLLDEIYSLGNDINAAAGRYYNAAPRRNYYAGISFQTISNLKK